MWQHEQQWRKATCTWILHVVGGTPFRHREIHKLTWCSPNGRDKSQIDHLMINGTLRRSLQDVRVRRGADVGSDHHLVTANLKLRRNGPDKARQQRFDVRKLKEPRVKSTFNLQLKNKFQALADAEEHTPPGTNDINTMLGEYQNSLYKDQCNLPVTPTEEKEGMDHSRYMASHWEQESPEEESHG